MDDQKLVQIFANKRPDHVYASKRFDGPLGRTRIVSQIVDGDEHRVFATIKDEVVLRVSPGERLELRAVLSEDQHRVTQLTIQRFSLSDGKPHKTAFSFVGQELGTLRRFLNGAGNLQLRSPEKARSPAAELELAELPSDLLRTLALQNPDVIAEVVRHDLTKSDVVSLAYRKAQLYVFENLLSSSDYFEGKMAEWGKRRAEDVWQYFFERNQWIFGYGLSLVYTSSLDEKKLEQVVCGFDFATRGKRVDALMKTRGVVSSLSFVEIKRSDTHLIARKSQPERPECWAVSEEVSAAVAQAQKTVYKAVKAIQSHIRMVDDVGNPTSEEAFLCVPRSYLVVGNLREFVGEFGTNEEKYTSFELYRRHCTSPEIVTFDELYERARCIVEHSGHIGDHRAA